MTAPSSPAECNRDCLRGELPPRPAREDISQIVDGLLALLDHYFTRKLRRLFTGLQDRYSLGRNGSRRHSVARAMGDGQSEVPLGESTITGSSLGSIQ